jgi:hypothetical protein
MTHWMYIAFIMLADSFVVSSRQGFGAQAICVVYESL